MTEQQIAAVKQALEALESVSSCVDGYYIPKGKQYIPEAEQAITALRHILAQDALDKKADNARELGLDYEQADGPISDVTEAVTKTVIEVEKLLCKKLGKQWRASGMSIQTLVDELANRSHPINQVAEPRNMGEPVAWMHKETSLLRKETNKPKGADWDADHWMPLYTRPASYDQGWKDGYKHGAWASEQQPADSQTLWAISYDGKTPYSLWLDGDGPLLDLEVKRQGGMACKMPLYTRPCKECKCNKQN